jgi:hypothetical protein
MLTGPPPQLKPPNWKQSRIRRQHFIALGLPVNLDEVLPRANGKPMPTLNITTRPASMPPESKNTSIAPGTSRAGTPRSGTPQGRRPAPSPFGPKPELNEKRISELLELKPGTAKFYPPLTFLSELVSHDSRVEPAAAANPGPSSGGHPRTDGSDVLPP